MCELQEIIAGISAAQQHQLGSAIGQSGQCVLLVVLLFRILCGQRGSHLHRFRFVSVVLIVFCCKRCMFGLS